MAKGPSYGSSVDFINLLKVGGIFGPVCFFFLSLLWYFMLDQKWISPLVFVILLLLNIPFTILAVVAIHRSVGSIAVGVVKTIFADGDIPPPPTYPRQDVLIVRGKYGEAAECFRDHLRIEPGDHEARLRLAHLLEMQLQAYDEAERLYLEIRRAQPPADARQQMRAANGLIDLYRKVGKGDRLKAELARFVERYQGSAVAEGAKRELLELKNADLTNESRRSPT